MKQEETSEQTAQVAFQSTTVEVTTEHHVTTHHKTAMSVAEGEAAAVLPQIKIMSLDTDLEPLRNFLENVTKVVNQHANMLNTMKSDHKKHDISLVESFNRLGEAISCADPESNKKVNIPFEKLRPENTGKPNEDATNRLANKILILNNVIDDMGARQDAAERAAHKHDVDMGKKADKADVKQKFHNNKEKVKKMIEDSYGGFDGRLKELEKKVNDALKGLETRITEVEVSTLWRIKDCEDLLKSRVSEQYVLDAIKGLEAKMQKEVGREISGVRGHFDNICGDIKGTIERMVVENNDKARKTKTKFDELDDTLRSKVDTSTFKENTKTIMAQIEEAFKKWLDYSAKVDPEIEELYDEINSLKESYTTVDTTMTTVRTDIDTMSKLLDETAKLANREPEKAKEFDYARLEALEKLLQDLQKNTNALGSSLSAVQSSLDGKVESSVYGAGLMRKMDRDEVMRLIDGIPTAGPTTVIHNHTTTAAPSGHTNTNANANSNSNTNNNHNTNGNNNNNNNHNVISHKIKTSAADDGEAAKAADDERLRKLQEELNELLKRVESLGTTMDKKMNRLRKEIENSKNTNKVAKGGDDGSSEGIRKEVDSLSTKIASIGELLTNLKRDYDNVHTQVAKLNNLLMMLLSEGNSTLASTQCCLSCGKGKSEVHFSPVIQPVKGTDGRLYQGMSSPWNGVGAEMVYDYGVDLYSKNDDLAKSHFETRHHMTSTSHSTHGMRGFRISAKDRAFSAKNNNLASIKSALQLPQANLNNQVSIKSAVQGINISSRTGKHKPAPES